MKLEKFCLTKLKSNLRLKVWLCESFKRKLNRELKIFFTFFVFATAFQLNAQNLFIPRDVQAAYKNGTRSMDGKPGKNYFQNFGRYDISIKVSPPNKNIQGSEKIVYYNNSADTIRNPGIKLILNQHAMGAIKNNVAEVKELTSGVHITGFKENGVARKWESDNATTFQSFKFSKPLVPHDSVTLNFDWNFDLSEEHGREGVIDSTTFFLAYFYPRLAVFDDINHWDNMVFNGSQEFYNDFNDYTLNVSVPKNFVVWSTGTLANSKEVLQPNVAEKLNASFTSNDVAHIATLEDVTNKKVTIQNETNTWRWEAQNVSDMALGVSETYLWDAGSVIVDTITKRRSSVQSAYAATSKDFEQMVTFGKHSLDWFSRKFPGVPYPFPKTTIFQGFADMEYPMMVNDSPEEDTLFARFVAEHEIAHSWFPFYMGINEHRYGFMDEGWTTANEYLIGVEDLGEETETHLFQSFRVERWTLNNSEEHQIPIITPGNILSGKGLGDNEYGKPALAYLAVKDYLGDAMFKKCLHTFMDRWHGKHPLPWDMFFSFNDAAGKNLNWFWNNWFFSRNYLDLSINKVETVRGGYNVTIDNIGGFASPTNFLIQYEDSTSEKIHQTPVIWEKDQTQTIVKISTKKKIKSLTLDGGIYMDADTSNNVWLAKAK